MIGFITLLGITLLAVAVLGTTGFVLVAGSLVFLTIAQVYWPSAKCETSSNSKTNKLT
jgi:precorrin-4 methylase